MAKYRQLHTEFWSDSFVLELTPEEKYFYLYVMTNTKTTQCGIYEISKRTIETDTGYNRETVEKLIKRFCDYKKILYCEDTRELMVTNWIKYNMPNNQNSIKCVQREIEKVKHHEFVKILFNKCRASGLDVEKIFDNYIIEEAFGNAPINDRVSENCSFEKVEKAPVEFNMEGKVKISKPLCRGLQGANKVSSDVIIMAIEEAVNYDAKTMKYISKILNSWISYGIKTGDEVKVYQKKLLRYLKSEDAEDNNDTEGAKGIEYIE